MISLARAWLSHPGFEILWHEQILFDLLSANVFKGEGEFITKLLQLKCDEQTQGPGNSTKTKRQKPWKHHWSCLEYTLGFDFSIWCHRFSDFEVNKRQRKGEKSWRQSENILFLWSKPSNYQEKLRCHACDGRTDKRRKVEKRAVFWIESETAISVSHIKSEPNDNHDVSVNDDGDVGDDHNVSPLCTQPVRIQIMNGMRRVYIHSAFRMPLPR